MKLSEFKNQLAANSSCRIQFVLPTGSKVPLHIHVTEVARVEKQFIDCGGTFRTELTCRLQTWFADDTDHRLTAGKLVGILNKAASFLRTEDLEVDVEHEAPFVSQFPIANISVENEIVVIKLGIRHTVCLAEDKCLPPNLLNKPTYFAPLPTFAKAKCC